MTDYMREYRRWLDSPAISESEWRELDAIKDQPEEIESRFYAPLDFGTAGLRGVMGVGLNRMNSHVVKHATQAFASVILREGEESARRGVIICYDCREHSEEFSREAACVMAANGIPVKLFDALRPTPELSFAIRHFGAIAGINVTASHNPREYNGYKVYWSDGAQLPPAHADSIADEMARIDIFTDIKSLPYDLAREKGLIEIIGDSIDEVFLEKVLAQAIDPAAVAAVADEFKVVYTPFHGAGYKLVPEALRRLGVKLIFPVPEQMVIDGAFPTVKSPNPENPEGFYLATELARRVGAKLIIGTDPDSDRVGTMALAPDGEFVTISGNQMGVLLLDYIINARRATNTMPEKPAALKSIVTTEMARVVAESNGVHMDETFTGFKFMAEKLAEYEQTPSGYKSLIAYEESYGYMIGDFVRDKDAVTASVLIAEMASSYYAKGMTLLDAIEALYEKYGCFAEKTMNLVMPGVDGLEKMAALMKSLRESPPAEIAGAQILRQRDYLGGKLSVPGLGIVGNTEINGSNVLYYELEDGASFIIRPSGTEPKIKIYILVRGESLDSCQEKIAQYEAYANEMK
ncbi:MAG: phospho-sugar mutase [Oscillospiraceae bacterium]|jgi:phosphoglucomutase|nr:phospho-sugar mutase [Oscillospiraceae bacterium]